MIRFIASLVILAAPFAGAAEVAFDPLKDAREAAYFDKQNQYTLAGGLVTFVGARSFDVHNREVFAHQRRIGDLEPVGNEFLGTGAPGVLIGASLWTLGEKYRSSHEVRAGQAALESLTASFLATGALKVSAQRQRPDQSDFYSFPSGHTSSIASTAMVMQEFYGWKAGVPLFALTALTAAARWSDDKHWLSDTVAGAALGTYFGHAFSAAHLSREAGEKSGGTVFRLYPMPIDQGLELIGLISL